MYEYTTKNMSELIPYINNSRTHSVEQIRQVSSSIKEFGFTNPILIDEDNNIIAGHGRLLAAEHLKINEVPCIVLAGLTEAQKKAYVIADNQLALNSGWDLDKLKLEVEHLQELEFDVDTIQAFKAAGFNYYNEAILVTPVGSLPLRAGKAMRASRKLGKTHQNILVFVKGDGKKAAQRCGDIQINIEEQDHNNGSL